MFVANLRIISSLFIPVPQTELRPTMEQRLSCCGLLALDPVSLQVEQ
jgi:hypothetical protein